MMIGKFGSLLTDYVSFDVSADLTCFAFALKDGILLYKSADVVAEACRD